MTREEAFLKIGELVAYARTQGWDDVYTDAFKALKQEPCEDAISRQATVERLCKVAEFMNEKRNGLGSPYVMAALFIQDNKDEFPPVTPKPKTGHWIINDGKEQGYDIAGVKTWYIQIMCDKCGFIKTTIEGHTGQYKYCPNCGQPKMVEPQAEKGNE